jgi:hypothetical protein
LQGIKSDPVSAKIAKSAPREARLVILGMNARDHENGQKHDRFDNVKPECALDEFGNGFGFCHDLGPVRYFQIAASAIAFSLWSEFRPENARGVRATEHSGAAGAELQLAADEAGDNAALIGNVLRAKPHDVGSAGGRILLGLGQGRTGAQAYDDGDKCEFVHISPDTLIHECSTSAIVP